MHHQEKNEYCANRQVVNVYNSEMETQQNKSAMHKRSLQNYTAVIDWFSYTKHHVLEKQFVSTFAPRITLQAARLWIFKLDLTYTTHSQIILFPFLHGSIQICDADL